MTVTPEIGIIGRGAVLQSGKFGWRAERLEKLASFGFPNPKAVAISSDVVAGLTVDNRKSLETAAAAFGPHELLAVRPSPAQHSWNGVSAFFNIGMSDSTLRVIAESVGMEVAQTIYGDFVETYALAVAKLPSARFAAADKTRDPEVRLKVLLDLYRQETGVPFPQDTMVQLAEVCAFMARKWNSPESVALRAVQSAPDNLGLGLVLQSMADGYRGDGCGLGKVASVNWESGARQESGQLRIFRDGKPVYCGGEDPIREYLPHKSAELSALLDELRSRLVDPQQIEFAFDGRGLWLLDSEPAPRSVPAAIRIAVELTEDGLITKNDALRRVEAASLAKVLHPQMKPDTQNTVIARGIPASPGAATGVIAFSSRAAERFLAAGNDCILVRAETGPEDFRGMHTAQGVLTGRGGLTSHAAVVARGLGVPCVVGASEIHIANCSTETQSEDRILIARDGFRLHEGDVITVDGTTGKVLQGSAGLVEPSLNEFFETFLSWADEARDIGVRANADTSDEVKAALKFKADGIGLCRTEHMFFEESRLAVMRRMLFAESAGERKEVLRKLIKMQTSDFTELFRAMPGRPVCIRLFDPPLHEFLPRGREQLERLAEALRQDLKHVTQRADDLKEFNPMLGMRGVRVGVVMPEIYEMQARAIFEAAVEVKRCGLDPVPEIMIPLVSANREVDLVRDYVDRVAAMVREKSQTDFQFKLGVMVETPRAALRAGDLAKNSDFLSFGTNDLTQMTYGLSRDDSQRFIDEYIAQGVYQNDPFGTLDIEGVGELLEVAASRGRQMKEQLTLSICGEHGGDPKSIGFCRRIGFNYVSCSPYRVPIARLAAAQCAIEQNEVS